MMIDMSQNAFNFDKWEKIGPTETEDGIKTIHYSTKGNTKYTVVDVDGKAKYIILEELKK